MATSYNTRNIAPVTLTGTTPKVYPFQGPATVHVPAGTTVKVEASSDPALASGAAADWVTLDASLVGPAMKKYDLDFAAFRFTAIAGGSVFLTSKAQ